MLTGSGFQWQKMCSGSERVALSYFDFLLLLLRLLPFCVLQDLARTVVDQLTADGGTNISSAMIAGLNLLRKRNK